MSLEIVIATRNRGKTAEIRDILGGGLEIASLDDFPAYPEPEENGSTFLENAVIKARAAHAATGLCALADDSGIEVDALAGAPGILSARYGGEGLTDLERCGRLLAEMEMVIEELRTARFRCVMVLYPAPEGGKEMLTTEGIMEGLISAAPSGGMGFGYDPVFYVPEKGKTVAEMKPEEKNSISHRYRALIEMKGLLSRECGIRFE